MIIFLIISFLKNLFFDSGDIKQTLNLMPFCSLCFFFITIYNFLVFNIKLDFEVLVSESYYRHIFFDMERNEFKKKEYIRFLMSNYSKYRFEDSYYYFFKEKIEKNFLIVDVKKYTKNVYPNDFFSVIKKHKPRLIKKK